MQEISYIGNELELFQHATVWKKYFGKFLKPYLNGKVLEVGAGIGSTAKHLCNGDQEKWICIEPDPSLYNELKNKIELKELPACCTAFKGVIQDLNFIEKYDAILYIDVIEHIERDAAELAYAKNLLAENGYLIVLVPAHQFVYSLFDKSIGHFRRYNKKMLRTIAPRSLSLKKMIYLDIMGLLASILNKFFLKQKYPSLRQIEMWDKKMVRISKIIDPIINYRTGKTLIAIWKNQK
jgi:SAM-dependent methyltransferase